MVSMEKREAPMQIRKAKILASFRCSSPFLGLCLRGSEKFYSSKSEEVTGSWLLLGSCWVGPKQTIMIKGQWSGTRFALKGYWQTSNRYLLASQMSCRLSHDPDFSNCVSSHVAQGVSNTLKSWLEAGASLTPAPVLPALPGQLDWFCFLNSNIFLYFYPSG